LKHVRARNQLIVKKFCASSLLITKINILRCMVSKISKFSVVKRNIREMRFDLVQRSLLGREIGVWGG